MMLKETRASLLGGKYIGNFKTRYTTTRALADARHCTKLRKMLYLLSKRTIRLAKLRVLNFCLFCVCVCAPVQAIPLYELLELSLQNFEFRGYHRFYSNKRPAATISCNMQQATLCCTLTPTSI